MPRNHWRTSIAVMKKHYSCNIFCNQAFVLHVFSSSGYCIKIKEDQNSYAKPGNTFMAKLNPSHIRDQSNRNREEDGEPDKGIKVANRTNP